MANDDEAKAAAEKAKADEAAKAEAEKLAKVEAEKAAKAAKAEAEAEKAAKAEADKQVKAKAAQSAKDEERWFKPTRAVMHDGEVYSPGDKIGLTRKQHAPLFAVGAVEEPWLD